MLRALLIFAEICEGELGDGLSFKLEAKSIGRCSTAKDPATQHTVRRWSFVENAFHYEFQLADSKTPLRDHLVATLVKQ